MSIMVKTPEDLDEVIETPFEVVPVLTSSAAEAESEDLFGMIEDAWSIGFAWCHGTRTKRPATWRPSGSQILRDGEVQKMPAGTASYVLTEDGWRHCSFPQAGRLRGPLLWAPAEPYPDEYLLRPHVGMRFQIYFIGCVATAMGAWMIASAAGASAVTTVISILGGAMGGAGLFTWLWRREPVTIASVNCREWSKVKLPQGVKLASYRPQEAAAALAQGEADDEVAASLQSYHAQRRRLASIEPHRIRIVDHTATMLDDLALRLQAVSHQGELRQTFLSLVDRAEAEVVRLIERKEAREVEALEGDMKALLTQIERHPA
jgi:hypothetical protein